MYMLCIEIYPVVSIGVVLTTVFRKGNDSRPLVTFRRTLKTAEVSIE